MSHLQSTTPRVSVVIPLYRSARFIDTIIANIEAMPASDVEILISDRHCHDDTIDRLETRYARDHRVRCLKHRDDIDWVGHINALLKEARGEYWRFLPHDDLSPPGSLEALMKALDLHPEAVIAYGPTQAIDGEGKRLPERDRPHPHPRQAEQGWTLGLVLEMFWAGYFDGAFKGLVRRELVMENQLLIKSTLGQVFPERCWLFALCLLGRFHFVREATYIKRFYEGSTSSQWTITGKNFRSAALVMTSYLRNLLKPPLACWYGEADLWLNAQQMARWQDDPQKGPRPPYQAAAPGQLPHLLRATLLSPSAAQDDVGSHHQADEQQENHHGVAALRMMPMPHGRRLGDVSDMRIHDARSAIKLH